MSALLRIEDLWVEGRPPGGEYAPILKGVSISVSRGEVLALIGESGSGKSTTSLATLGYARPGCRITSGQVFLNETDILNLAPEQKRGIRGNRIAYVAQSAAAAFNPALSIGYQVTESARIHRTTPLKKAQQQAVEIFRQLGLPDPESLGRRYPHQVSGGQLQRMMAAMALSSGPELLVFDEPTSALDVTTQIEVLMAFKAVIQRQNVAAIYVAHDLAVVAQIADHVVVMRDGEVVDQGSTEDILYRPQHEYTKDLLTAVRPPPRSALDGRGGADGASAAVKESALEIRNVTAGYGRAAKTIVLRDIDVIVERGQVVGIIGESGCGKSTLARVIAGLLPQLAGEVLHKGRSLPATARRREKSDLQRIQIVFQMPDVSVNPRHRIRDILGRPLQFFFGMSAEQRKARVAELLEMVELPAGFESRFPGELSGGQKQRVNLARALAAEPEVILCDEVTSSLDTIVSAAIIKLLKRLRDQFGVAFVFISHDLSTVASFANRIVVLYAGRVIENGPVQDVLSPPYHPYTRLLLASVPELRTGWLEDVMGSREARSGIAGAVKMTDVGCPFVNRCPLVVDGLCDSQQPPTLEPAPGHRIYCHREITDLGDDVITH
jgi:peptide/nickel transport system ATP-binding protein